MGKNNEGATSIEYTIMLALIATVIISSVGFVGAKISYKYDAVCAVWSDPIGGKPSDHNNDGHPDKGQGNNKGKSGNS